MKSGARLIALQEISNSFLTSHQPLDSIIHLYFSTRRYAGSKDRRCITDHIFNLFRHWEQIKWNCPHDSGHLLACYFRRVEGWSLQELELHFPIPDEDLSEAYPLPEWVQGNVPTFMWPDFLQTYGLSALAQAEALKKSAPVDLRVNVLKTTRKEVVKCLQAQGIDSISLKNSPWGIRLLKRYALEGLDLFKQGLIEIQDEGSQRLALFCQAQPHQYVLDLCAGAGGKTLALAAMMQDCGKIVATDQNPNRLQRAFQRLKRAQVKNAVLKKWPLQDRELKRPFDLVVLDVPCSGSGTWRRSPDLRVRFTEKDFQAVLKTQADILNQASSYVKQGGHLVYMTCSMLQSENQQQMKDFLKRFPSFSLVDELYLSPLLDNTDGFYGARLIKT